MYCFPSVKKLIFFDRVRIHKLLYYIIMGPNGIFVTCENCSRWDKSGHLIICEGTFATWELTTVLGGTRWDKSGHPGTSETWIVLGGTSQDIQGYPGM